MDKFLAGLLLVGIFTAVFLFIWVADLAGDQVCQKRYGSDWRVSGYYTKYCTNSSGEIKGF